jgi:ATP-dependent RNA helicase DeaD
MNPDPTDSTSTPPTFDVLPLSPELRRAIDELGYIHPTPVQREVFEPASRGRDLVVQARTGTGKTAAFGMPVVDAMVQRSLSAVQVVILCPTRELALQVHRELDTLGRHRGVKSVAVYGGAPMARQIEELAAGAQVLAGTPGRVLDHLRRGSLDPRSVRVFILDESDEMLSMGFLPQINEIHGHLPSGHQTLLFSATLPPDIQRLAETRLKDPLFLTLSGDHIGALDIQHLVYLTRGDKLKDFIQMLEVENPESAIVFCNTRDETKRVASALDRLGFSSDWLNADLAQAEREKVMAATRGGDLRFLVCTDVAARGIDISHLTHVINYDMPESPESYVHRTGRTGRAGRTGTAISLIEPSDIGRLYMLRLTYKIFPVERQSPTAGEVKTRLELDVVEMFVEAFANRKIHPDDMSLARRLLTHGAAEQIVAGLLRDHLGARPEAVREATDTRRARNPAPEDPLVRGGEQSAHTPATTSQRNSAPRQSREGQTNDRGSGSPVDHRPDHDDKSKGTNTRPFVRERPQSQILQRAPTRPRGPVRRSDNVGDESKSRPALGNDSGGADRVPDAQSRSADPTATPVPVGSIPLEFSESLGPNAEGLAGMPSPRSGVEPDDVPNEPHRVREPADPKRPRVYRDEAFEFGYSIGEAPENSGDLPTKGASPPFPAPRTTANRPSSATSAEIYVNVGHGEGAEAADFLRLLEQAGVGSGEPVEVSVRRNHSFVRVSARDFQRAEAALNGAKIAGKMAMAERARGSRP